MAARTGFASGFGPSGAAYLVHVGAESVNSDSEGSVTTLSMSFYPGMSFRLAASAIAGTFPEITGMLPATPVWGSAAGSAARSAARRGDRDTLCCRRSALGLLLGDESGMHEMSICK